jgi:hypothetical protein
MDKAKGGYMQRLAVIVGLSVCLAGMLSGCQYLSYFDGEARDVTHQHETLIGSVPSGANCTLSEPTGRQFELTTPAAMPLGALVPTVMIECRLEGHFLRRRSVPRGGSAATMERLLAGQEVSQEIGPWPYKREQLGAVYPNWINLSLARRDFASIEDRDAYYAKRKVARAANWAFTAEIVQQECIAGVAGAVVTDTEVLPAVCGDALARLREQRDRDLLSIELDRRRAGPAY